MLTLALIAFIMAVLLLKEGSQDAAKAGAICLLVSIVLLVIGLDGATISKIPAVLEWICDKLLVASLFLILGPFLLFKVFFMKKD